MDILDDLGLGEHEEIIVAFHVVARPVGKAGTAIVGLLQFVALDHGAHGPVDNEDALGGGLFEGGVAGKAFIVQNFRFKREACDGVVGELPLTLTLSP